MANETHRFNSFLEKLHLSFFPAALRSMEEQTLKLAQKLARESSIISEEGSDFEELRDGNPLPLVKSKLEEKIKGFR